MTEYEETAVARIVALLFEGIDSLEAKRADEGLMAVTMATVNLERMLSEDYQKLLGAK